MKARKPVVIYNPYEKWPPYGESDISLRLDGLDLYVDITYDIEKSDYPGLMTLHFVRIFSFEFGAYPGVYATNIEYEKTDRFSSLIEYQDSEPAIKWSEHYNGLYKVRHFAMYFLSANQYLEVFAKDVKITTKE